MPAMAGSRVKGPFVRWSRAGSGCEATGGQEAAGEKGGHGRLALGHPGGTVPRASGNLRGAIQEGDRMALGAHHRNISAQQKG